MKSTKTLLLSFLLLFAAGFFLFMVSLPATAGTSQPMGLRDALWVTNRNYEHLYPPHSPQSRAVIAALTPYGLDAAAENFPGAVLYRAGQTTADSSTEPILLFLE